MLSEAQQRLFTFFARDLQVIAWDLVDIVLVACVLYYVLLLLKGTRAMQVGVGLALVFVIYQVAKRFGLVTLYTMLDTLLTSIVLIIVVLFQQDLRRALMRFGRRPLFTAARSALETQVIEEVVKAASSLAQKRIGALIVFEREALLDEFVEAGSPLDASVSKELLYSVFIPSFENPMHDGAVIIRDGRVQQAGAFLPLSASTKLERSLGTRHRAAIGLSEETDAVVVVVSEERGAISLCFNGNIARSLDAASLRTALLGLLTRPRTRPRGRGGEEESAHKRASQPPGPGREGGGRESSSRESAGRAVTKKVTPPKGEANG